MKAIVLTEPGNVQNLVFRNLDQPAPQQNEVLIKVKYISINPVDIKTRLGKAMYGTIKIDNPVILGWDISGEVAATGAAVKKFKAGDQVFGMVNFPGHGKAYAEYITAPEDHLALKHAEISHQQAAAGTLAALTAWQVLVHQAKVQAGQRVLIQAAAGGVGHFAVQIAKYFGAYVIGTASAANAGFLQELGIDEHIDYKNSSFEEVVQPVDLVFDSLGVESVARSLKVLKAGGQIISIVGGVNEENKSKAAKSGITGANYLVHSSGEDTKQLAELFKSGDLKAHVSDEFNFENIADAHKQIETGKTRGKIVVRVTA